MANVYDPFNSGSTCTKMSDGAAMGGAAIRYAGKRMYLSRFLRAIGAAVFLMALPTLSMAQLAGAGQAIETPQSKAADALPDAPLPQVTSAQIDPPEADESSSQAPAPATTPTPDQPGQSSSSSQAPATQAPGTQAPADGTQPLSAEDQRKKADEQLKAQEHQRVFGVMATFNTTRDQNAIPLSPRQKFQLFFKSSTDPWPFLLAGVIAGIGQADNSEPPWGQGARGYAKRFGAGYSDAFIGNFFGNAVLPTLLHEDPRYFQRGKGSFTGRALWAAGSTVWCKRDKGGWGPNYANVIGNFIGSAISTAYKPEADRHVGDVLVDGLTVSAEGIIGAEVIEFWPDLVKHHKRKKAEKLARQQAHKDAQGTAKPGGQPPPADKPEKPKD